MEIRNGLALIGIGLLCMWLGLIYAANVFGVATEHARQIVASRWQLSRVRTTPFDQVVRIGRITGVAFMIFSLLWVVAGILEIARGGS